MVCELKVPEAESLLRRLRELHRKILSIHGQIRNLNAEAASRRAKSEPAGDIYNRISELVDRATHLQFVYTATVVRWLATTGTAGSVESTPPIDPAQGD